jgi:hypothetical protein
MAVHNFIHEKYWENSLKKICQTAYQAASHHTAKSLVSYLKILKERVLPDTKAVILPDFQKFVHFSVSMP